MMQLRDYQQEAINSVYSYFYAGATGNPILVMPTGSGKSVIIGALCKDIMENWPNQRILILSHVKELLEQNYDKIVRFWPLAPAGLYCTGLKQKRAHDDITVASIQSVYKKAHLLGHRNIILIDECHLLGNKSETMYRAFLNDMQKINPNLKVIGLTATDWRLESGSLTEGEQKLFTDVCHQISMLELIRLGHLAPLRSKPSLTQADLSQVKTIAGDFSKKDSELALDKIELTKAAIDEMERLGSDRKSWLIFCSGVLHARHVCEELCRRGKKAAYVTGKTPAPERDMILKALKAGTIEAVTNANVLTTGFDAPNIDLIGLLRPTKSPGLYIQMLGRGMRPCSETGKRDCLVLDFAGNIERFGPVTHVEPPRSKKVGRKSDRFIKTCLICPECRLASPLDAKECVECGYIFPEPGRVVKHATTATTASVMDNDSPIIEEHNVTSVEYQPHKKEGSPTSFRVDYFCGWARFSEWVCLEHEGFAREKAKKWWLSKTKNIRAIPPETVDEALGRTEELIKPNQVRVKKEGKYWRITSYGYRSNIQTETTASGGS